MNLRKWKPYLISMGLALGVGTLSGLLSMGGMRGYESMVTKPALTPPGWLFPIVWTILYSLMGIGAAMVYLKGKPEKRDTALNLYVAQLIVNFFWSLIFFNAQAFGFAVIWIILLLALVVWMTWEFSMIDKTAALLQIPYIIWLLFATYLTIAVWVLNR